jgi:hypothetical protein
MRQVLYDFRVKEIRHSGGQSG